MNENQEREYVFEREIEELKAKLDTVRDEALGNLATRDAAIVELRAAIDNMLSVMARRGRPDDGDWSKPINQMRAALAKGAKRHA